MSPGRFLAKVGRRSPCQAGSGTVQSRDSKQLCPAEVTGGPQTYGHSSDPFINTVWQAGGLGLFWLFPPHTRWLTLTRVPFRAGGPWRGLWVGCGRKPGLLALELPLNPDHKPYPCPLREPFVSPVSPTLTLMHCSDQRVRPRSFLRNFWRLGREKNSQPTGYGSEPYPQTQLVPELRG